MASDNFQQVIEVALRSATDPSLRELLQSLQQLGQQSDLSDEQLSALTNSISAFNAEAGNAAGLQIGIDKTREYVAQQEAVAAALAASDAKLRETTQAQQLAAQALADATRATAAARQARDEYAASGERTAERTRELAAAVRSANAEQREAKDNFKSANAALKESSAEYERASAAQTKLSAGVEKTSAALREAGLSVDDLAEAQRELDARQEATRTSTQQLAASIQQSVEANREATAAARQNAAAQKELADANETLGRRGFAEVRAEIEKVKQAYRTLASSGTLSIQELSQAKAKTIERTRELRAEFGSLGNSLRQVQGSLVVAGASLFTVQRLLGNATRSSTEFGKAVDELSTLSDDTSGLDALAKSAEEMARQFGGPAAAQVNAYYEIVSAGTKDAADAAVVLSQSNKLAIAGVTELGVATDGITSVLNAYGKSAEQAERVSDTLFAAVRAGKTKVDELAGSIGQVAPLAATADVAFEELAATIATLTQGGVATNAAVTQLKAVLASVIKPTTDAKDAAKELGIDFSLAGLRAKGLAGFLQDIAVRAGDNEESLGRLFGSVEGLSAVFALIGKSSENFSANLRSVSEAAGATQTAFDKIDAGSAQKLARLGASVEQLQRAFGNAVSTLAPLVDGLTAVINAFNTLPDPVKTSAAGVVALTAVVAPLAIAIAQSRAALVLLAGSLKGFAAGSAAAAASTGLLARSFALLTGPIGLVVTAFGALAAAVVASNAAAEARLEADRRGIESLRRYNDALQERIETEARAKRAQESNRDLEQQGAIEDLRSATEELAATQQKLIDIQTEAGRKTDLFGIKYERLRIRQEELKETIRQAGTEFERQGKLLAQQEGGFEKLLNSMFPVSGALRNVAAGVRELADAESKTPAEELAERLRKAGLEADKLGKELSSIFSASNFDTDSSGLGALALALADVSEQSGKTSEAVRETLGAELAKLSGEDLLAFQQAAESAFGAAGNASDGAANVLETTLQEQLRRLGVNMEAAGIKITEQGRQIIATFRGIADGSKASAGAILASFSAALSRANTASEVEELRRSLQSAFTAGKITAEQYGAAVSAAAQRSREIVAGANEATGAIEGVGEAGRQAALVLLNSFKASRAALAIQANGIAQDIGEALSSGEPTAGLQEKLTAVEAQIIATNNEIKELETSLSETGKAGEDAGDRARNGLGTFIQTAKGATDAAKGAGTAVEEIGDKSTEAGEKVKSGVSSALLGLISITQDARATAEDFGVAATEAFDRLRGELGIVNRTGKSTAAVMQEIADRAQGAADFAEELKLQIGDTEARAKRTADAFAEIARNAREASSELDTINRQLQDEADRRVGNEEAVRRRQYEDQLRRIDELAKKGGAAEAANAAKARDLARKNFEADLAEIRAREREQLDSDDRVDRSRTQRRSGGSATGSGAISPTNARPERGTFAPTVQIQGALGTPQELARAMFRELERLQRIGFRG